MVVVAVNVVVEEGEAEVVVELEEEIIIKIRIPTPIKISQIPRQNGLPPSMLMYQIVSRNSASTTIRTDEVHTIVLTLSLATGLQSRQHQDLNQ